MKYVLFILGLSLLSCSLSPSEKVKGTYSGIASISGIDTSAVIQLSIVADDKVSLQYNSTTNYNIQDLSSVYFSNNTKVAISYQNPSALHGQVSEVYGEVVETNFVCTLKVINGFIELPIYFTGNK